MVGTSNILGINEDKLTTAVETKKVVKYTLEETETFITSFSDTPNILVLHSLTNNLKAESPTQCVDKLSQIICQATTKWPYLKYIISFTTQGKDNINNFTNAQIINALIKQTFTGVDNIFFAEHSNMLTNGNPNDNLLKDDRYHLNDKGISLLASNIKRVIHVAVGIPLPFVRNRSRSRHRQIRGRGRGHGYD